VKAFFFYVNIFEGSGVTDIPSFNTTQKSIVRTFDFQSSHLS